jgi:dTDP-4-dehydrorhamnose 3,5-epimerase
MNKNMIKDVVITQLNKYKDDRGWLCEIFREDELNYKVPMSYISETKAGMTRGPHEHKEQSDLFVFIGPGKFKLYLWDNRKDSETYQEKMEIEGGEDNLVSVIVPPGVVHGYKCISDIPAWCINLPNKLYKGKNKAEEIDEIRWEEDPDSPFKIN